MMMAGFGFLVFHEYYVIQSVLSIIREVIGNAGSVAAGSAGIAIAGSGLTRGMMVIASYL